MSYSEMTIDEIREARNTLAGEIETADGARLDEISAEIDAINNELETRKAAESKRNEVRSAVAKGDGATIKEFNTMPEQNTRTVDEIRNSKEYIDAYARYIKTEDPRECRALLTMNATDPASGNSNSVPVPTYIEGRIRTAWEDNDLLSFMNRTFIRGNVGVGFELSATDAVGHEEGAAAPAEEQLVLGTVTLIPTTFKKWIRISDEVLDMGGREFLDYIYDEITAKILKALRDAIVEKITMHPAVSLADRIGVPTVQGAPTLSIVAQALGLLSDEADDITIIINRQTHAQFIAAMAANGYMFDPFMGYRVRYSSELPAYSSDLSASDKWMVVGDLRAVQVNFPAGDGVKLKYDDLTEAQADLVKIVGRLPVAYDITVPGRLAMVTGGTGGQQ